MMRFLYVTHLTSEPLEHLESSFLSALDEGQTQGLTPQMDDFEQFCEYVWCLAEQTPLTEALEFVDNLLVNFDFYSFLFN
ncbi:MAG: hypothetical protein AAF975_02035 [Spirochaetota bacterium]